jgi:hypothetical protein
MLIMGAEKTNKRSVKILHSDLHLITRKIHSTAEAKFLVWYFRAGLIAEAKEGILYKMETFLPSLCVHSKKS